MIKKKPVPAHSRQVVLGKSQKFYLVSPQVKMPRLTNLISLVSLISLASITTCRPVLEYDPSETFSLTPAQPLPPFSPDSALTEIPGELDETDYAATQLAIPGLLADSSSGQSLFYSPSFDVASGSSCKNPNLLPTCCSASNFDSATCIWGTVCFDSQVQLCCVQNSDATATDCEPPKNPPPPPPGVVNYGENGLDEDFSSSSGHDNSNFDWSPEF